ncbi:type II and III secretion system protein [Lentisphaerota bacterium ZTH]|nr:type II and III secretion system protein [Lentisphaerota bacterium]WET05554.1 type II and III secretion system protein [Lentisphaerota bacterium ZTH]
MGCSRLLLSTAACCVVAVQGFGSSPKVELKIDPGQSLPAGARADAEGFVSGKYFYNAIPATPARGQAIKIISTKDDKDYICRIYKLKNKVAAEIRVLLLDTVEKEGGSIESIVNTFNGVNYLIITAPSFQFPFFEKTIHLLDNKGTSSNNDGFLDMTYRMKHRLASEVAKFLKETKLSDAGTVFADDSINMLYLCDVPSSFNSTVADLKNIDVAPQMVRIEAEIIEVEIGNGLDLGLNWNAWKAALPESIDMSVDLQRGSTSADGVAKLFASSINLDGLNPRAAANFINYLISTGKAKVLSSPVIVAKNGAAAEISSLDRICYTDSSDNTQQVNSGINLKITPVIGTETLSLNVEAQVKSVTGFGADGNPLINTRSTTADIILKSGEVFSLSGLRRDTIAHQEDKIPVLGNIPLLGYLFKEENDVKHSTEIIVLLKPEIVSGANQSRSCDMNLRKSALKELITVKTKKK